MRSTAILVGASVVYGSIAAAAGAEEPTRQPTRGYHHSVHHHFRNGERHEGRHLEAHRAQPAPASSPTRAPQAAPFGLALPHIAPYPKQCGDEDGMSEDQNDCNKGCIDGNTAD